MPTINLNRDLLFQRLGKVYSDDEFADLCFALGLELDEVTTEKQMISKEQGIEKADASDDVIYRIEVPANRYDLLCVEGLVRAILIFLQKIPLPQFTVKPGKQVVTVTPSTRDIRPHVTAAILRDVTFTEDSYKSFIDLQDKLHQNVCRQRTLVSMGTHDLDDITGSIVYDAQKPNKIKFIALKQTEEKTAAQLMELYAADNKLKSFLSILQDKPLYPVFFDEKKTVLSFPPIINSEKTKIKLTTRNVFIEITATDKTKASLVLDTLVAMFSQYCAEKFTVESVTIKYPDGKTETYPKLETRIQTVSVDQINKGLGTALQADQIVRLLLKMGLESKSEGNNLLVQIPPTRHDILHACDVVEDVGIAYGYNEIPVRLPNVVTIGKQLTSNKVCDQLRSEISRCGFTEVLTFALCSNDEMEKINRSDSIVTISNPKALDFQVLRTSLISGLLKTAAANKKMKLPLKLFEVSDVVLKDETRAVGSRNQRMLAVQYLNSTPGFEIVQGILDRIMKVMGIPFNEKGYQIAARKDAAFFDGRCAAVTLEGKEIGVLGVLHPNVLTNFSLTFPASVFELNVEQLLQYYVKHENE